MSILTLSRAHAVFASDLPTHSEPEVAELAAAIRHTVRALGGMKACLGEVAYAYGDCPETAATRMHWARAVVAGAYPDRERPSEPRPAVQPAA